VNNVDTKTLKEDRLGVVVLLLVVGMWDNTIAVIVYAATETTPS
jgi:hypothetical protein